VRREPGYAPLGSAQSRRRIQEPRGPAPIFRQRSAGVAIASLESLAEGLGVTPGVTKQAPYVPERRAGKGAFPVNQSAYAPAAVLSRRYEDVSSAEVAVNQASDAVKPTQADGARLQPPPQSVRQQGAEAFARQAMHEHLLVDREQRLHRRQPGVNVVRFAVGDVCEREASHSCR